MQHPNTTMILAAGGSSSRMGETVDKLFEPIYRGLPAIAFGLTAAQECACIDEIVVSIRSENMLALWDLAKALQITKLTQAVTGGESRQQSVFSAVEAASGEAKFYAVHDAARPFVSRELIARVCGDAYRYGAAVPCVPVKDTIKEIRDGFVSHTHPRSAIAAVQTPQVFDAALYRRAMSLARQTGKEFTDDCQLMELIGARVFVSEGDEHNFKLTTPPDLQAAILTAQKLFGEE